MGRLSFVGMRIVNVCSCLDPDGLIVEFIQYEPGLLGSRIDYAAL